MNAYEYWDDAEALTPEDIANLLHGQESGEDKAPSGPEPPESGAALDAALADLEDDAYRTGRLATSADVQRTAARHHLTAADSARLELLAAEEGLTEAPPERRSTPGSGSMGWVGDTLDAWFAAASKFPLLTAEDEVQLARAFERGRGASVELADPACDPALRPKLDEIAERGRNAQLTLVCSNLRLVASIARRYRSDGLDRVDVMQEGVLGLLRAVEKFEWRLGFKLSTYATHWIRQGVQRGIDTHGRIIRIPVHVLERIRGVKRQARKLEVRLGREPTLAELATAVGIELSELAFLRDLERDALSLDEPVAAEGESSTLGELIAAPDDPVEITAARIERSEEIARAVDALDTRSRTIIRKRFGLEDDEPYTLEEVGRELGITRERVRQLETKALEILADTAREQGWEG